MSILQVSGSRVEFLEQGSGEPVVLLHSSSSSSAQWRSLAERLSERYQIIAPDLYGYGGTAHWPGRGPFHLESEAEIALAALGRDEPAHFVGHSYGGALALHIARFRPDLVRSLTLYEPVAFHLLRGADAPAFAEISEVAESVVRAVASGEYIAGLGRFLDYWNPSKRSAEIPAEKRYAMAARLPKIALDFHAAFNEPTRLEDFRSVTVPTLLLRGTESPWPTQCICDVLQHALPDARLESVEGAGHMGPITHRDAVNAMIVAHVDLNSGDPASISAAAGARAQALAARSAAMSTLN